MKTPDTTKTGPVSPKGIAPFSTLSPDRMITGRIVDRNGSRYYEVDGAERMEPFLMTMASDSDHWLYLLSNGGMTAGRGDPDGALLPYYTQDKLMAMNGRTGNRTIVRIGDRVWQPFGPSEQVDGIRRRVRKNDLGNRIELEEVLAAEGLVFRLVWRPCERFGFVRRVELTNTGEAAVAVSVLDGLVNLLPPGLGQRFQNEFSILGDAYKQSELVATAGLGLYHLSSVPTDLAEPKESLRATAVWQEGPTPEAILLSDVQVRAFINGGTVTSEDQVRGRSCAYLAHRNVALEPGATVAWYVCADTGFDIGRIEALKDVIGAEASLGESIEADCARTEARLSGMLAEADGLQCTSDQSRCMRHTSNTLFNLMRGGAAMTGYRLPMDDALRTVSHFNKAAGESAAALLAGQPELRSSDPWDPKHPLGSADKNILRLLREYLPLGFGRRHGDPSRPWNRFSIRIREADGSPRFYYEGNWRDIFQNWEALLQAYPEYAEAAICRFLNASSADGYNPYRLNKDGFEWERPEPGDPWANIGYWGDHQIIYLLRLLENSVRFHPGRLPGMLKEETFVYAEIPYRIRPFCDLLADPRDTVDFDADWEARIAERVKDIGADGKLMPGPDGGLCYVNLLEKLLVPLMAKLANYVPGGGIWMNTQRPEWNDANNALVGYGVSVVTLGYVARYLKFLTNEFGVNLRGASFDLSTEVADLLMAQLAVFTTEPSTCDGHERLAFMEQLGKPVSAFRKALYENGFTGNKRAVKGDGILQYLEAALRHVEACLRENERDDGLWHSYNLIDISPESIQLKHLFVMLEGQVSILSSGILGLEAVLKLLRSLKESDLYRADQDSYLLYPNRARPAFYEKNRLSRKEAEAVPLVRSMLESGDLRVLSTLPSGDVAFNGDFHNAKDVAAALDSIPEAGAEDREGILDLFETAFHHHAFTGRSGTFFAYEGLGSIYWHMVSKLVLAVQECYLEFEGTAGTGQRQALHAFYRALREGLGINKNPAVYGAIPTDAYSHTPAHAGAQQPGMTGQVKEDILIRLNELGVRIRNGQLGFDPSLLEDEFLAEPVTVELPDGAGGQAAMEVPAGALAFSLCGIPVVYQTRKNGPELRVVFKDGKVSRYAEYELPEGDSREVFMRTGKVVRIECSI